MSRPELSAAEISVNTQIVSIGGALEFEILLELNSALNQPLVDDYLIHHVRASGEVPGGADFELEIPRLRAVSG